MKLRRCVLVPCLVALVAPAAATAQTGGAQTGGAEAGTPSPAVARATDGVVSLASKTGGFYKKQQVFNGTVPAKEAGRTVTLERLDDLTGTWSPITYTTAVTGGTWKARWKTDRLGAQRIRARVSSSKATTASSGPEIGITVYKRQKATWYGPGFYGNKTACGIKLTKTTVGVAHRTHPCGTQVQIHYKGRTVTAPVIDRGPFANGAKWDLTSATAQQVGLEYTDNIGVLKLESAAPAAKK